MKSFRSSTNRRGWNQSSIELRMKDGELLHITAPGESLRVSLEDKDLTYILPEYEQRSNSSHDDSIEEKLEEGSEIEEHIENDPKGVHTLSAVSKRSCSSTLLDDNSHDVLEVLSNENKSFELRKRNSNTESEDKWSTAKHHSPPPFFRSSKSPDQMIMDTADHKQFSSSVNGEELCGRQFTNTPDSILSVPPVPIIKSQPMETDCSPKQDKGKKGTNDPSLSDKMQEAIFLLSTNAEKISNQQQNQLMNILIKTPTYNALNDDSYSKSCSTPSNTSERYDESPTPNWFKSLLMENSVKSTSECTHEASLSPFPCQVQMHKKSALRNSSDSSLSMVVDHVPARLNTAVIMRGQNMIQTEQQTYLVPSIDEQTNPLIPTMASRQWKNSNEDMNRLEGSMMGCSRDSKLSGGWSFPLPELPKGVELIINILSTWGDKHYVGLTGIEVFTSSGEKADISKISSNPPYINSLPEYSKDPKILIDGVNQTQDEQHMWLAPFNIYSHHITTIQLAFQTVQTISMIRIWNYNKSQYFYRGVRDIEILLDGQLIFTGEICRAHGADEEGNELAETILFTTDEDILYYVAANDEVFPWNRYLKQKGSVDSVNALHSSPPMDTTLNSVIKNRDIDKKEFFGKTIVLSLLSSWEGRSVQKIGLNRFILLDSVYIPIPLKLSNIRVSSECISTADLSSLILFDCEKSNNHIFKLASPESCVSIKITLDKPVCLGGIKVWNCTGSLEECSTGVKTMNVAVDNDSVCPSAEGFLVRKGLCTYIHDDGQFLNFKIENHLSRFESSIYPSGFVVQIVLISSWGDLSYIGLTGLELLDGNNSPIKLSNSNIVAHPSSLENDVCTLIDGINNSEEYEHMWLAPVVPSTIYIMFDMLYTASGITLWNYAKTPSNGVKDFSVFVDDNLVYKGQLPKSSLPTSGILPTVVPPLRSHTFYFNDEFYMNNNFKVSCDKFFF